MTILLVIIYIAFISLGLPDSLLGSAWPIMQVDLGADLGLAGVISMVICAGTVVSSLFSHKLVTKFGTGKITLISVLMTAIALLGFSLAPSVGYLLGAAIPLGLGAGSVDAALNHFIALYYKAKHMSWLHCFWGIGATAGPAIMSLFLMEQSGWKMGYFTIAIIQVVLVVALFVTLPFWKLVGCSEACNQVAQEKVMSNQEALKIPYVKLALISFVFFSATEITTGLWSSSFLVNVKGVSPTEAARWVSYFYGGITIGRLVTGFLTMKVKNDQLIRVGQLTCILGVCFLLAPLPKYFAMVGLILLGLGTSPIYPCMLHETPNRFGKEHSGAIMGLQMSFAYIGSTLAPVILGGIATKTSITILPYFLLICILMMLLGSEILRGKIHSTK